MTFDDYVAHDATGLSSLVRQGAVSPQELLACALRRAHAVNGDLGAISSWHEDFARLQLQNASPQLSNAPFYGVPFLLKDLYSFMAGTGSANGSRLCRIPPSDRQSTLVNRFLAAGLIMFGKTSTPELGLNVVTEPVGTGPCRNPFDLAHSPGGSSGGAAAAVAAGIVPAAHASDGGGSIRIPAAHCGLVGLKPSRGLMPTGPAIGEGWSGLAVSNVISRSVRDTARMMDCLAGPEPGSPYAAPSLQQPFVDHLDKPETARTIALMTRPLFDVVPEMPCVDAARKTALILEGLGHHVEEARPEIDEAEFARAFMTIVTANLTHDLANWQQQLGDRFDQSQLERCTVMLAALGEAASAADLVGSIQFMHRTGRELGRFFQHYDAILSPTVAALPPKIGTVDQNSDRLEPFLDANKPYTAFTALYNAIGCPAISLPVIQDHTLPVGVMLGTAMGGDGLLIELAATLERARPWFHRRPKL